MTAVANYKRKCKPLWINHQFITVSSNQYYYNERCVKYNISVRYGNPCRPTRLSPWIVIILFPTPRVPYTNKYTTSEWRRCPRCRYSTRMNDLSVCSEPSYPPPSRTTKNECNLHNAHRLCHKSSAQLRVCWSKENGKFIFLSSF